MVKKFDSLVNFVCFLLTMTAKLNINELSTHRHDACPKFLSVVKEHEPL